MVLHLYKKQNEAELELIQCGHEDCAPGHSYGPAVRSFYLIHFVKSGRGIFRSEMQTRELTAGDAFLICPGQLVYYKADETDPWSYIWVGFHGSTADSLLERAGLSTASPLLHDGEEGKLRGCFQRLVDTMDSPSGDLFATSAFYEMLGIAADCCVRPGRQTGSADQYCDLAKEIMRRNMSEQITISDVAASVGLSRSYFSQIFTGRVGVPPQRFLMDMRLDIAADMLKETNLSIAHIAASVGYDNQFLFSRIFKKNMGQSPSRYRSEARTARITDDIL